MKRSRIGKRLEKLANGHGYARLTRPFKGDPVLRGNVVAVGSRWVLVRAIHDFQPNGYVAWRVKDLCGVRRRRKSDRFYETMLLRDGLGPESLMRIDVSLDSTAGLLKALQEGGENVSVECEDRHGDDDFFIGRNLKVGRKWLDFAHFDPMGRWDVDVYRIRLSCITQIQIDTPYSVAYSKYLEHPDPPPR